MERFFRFFLILTCAAACVLCSCTPDNPPPPPPPDPPIVGDPTDRTGNFMTRFAVRLSSGASTSAYQGVINNALGTITINLPGTRWIEDVSSAASDFSSSDGSSVSVGGKVQTSGLTRNDFSKPVVFTVTAENGDERQYTVTVILAQSTGLPVVHIETRNGVGIHDKENYVDSEFTIIDPFNAANNIRKAGAGVRGRGNITWNYAKKPYRVKLDSKASVFGLTSAKNWVLLANWQDPTFIMNTVAFELSRLLGGLEFTPTVTHVELFLNGDYKGSYALCEHIQVNVGRINIDEFNDVLLELDAYYDEPNRFRSQVLNMPVNIKSPEFEGVSSAQRGEFIDTVKEEYNQMEQAVMTGSFEQWRGLMDVGSLIDFLIVNEVIGNTELEHPKSTFLYKRAGGKWTWGPIWDCDWAYGYSGGGQNYWVSGTATTMLYGGTRGDGRPGIDFFNRAMKDPAFRQEYKARWQQVRPLIAEIDGFVGEMGDKLAASDVQNKKVWGSQYSKNYQDQISRMRSWLRDRIAYIDGVVAGY